MAVSRIEKFREYRKSIISDDEHVLKTPINTDLKTTPVENAPKASQTEEVFLKKLKNKKLLDTILFLLIVIVLTIVLVVYGMKVF